MKRISSLVTLGIMLLTLPLQAGKYAVKDIPMVHLQDSRRYVSNPDGILTPTSVASMDSILYQLEQQTGIQTLVVAVEDIEGGDCFDFTYQLGQQNGIGEKGRDNGLVILLATQERCVQFITGYGLEGTLPDAICKRIQERYMLEDFRKGDWSAGMLNGVRATAGYLDGSMERIESDNDATYAIYTFLFLFILILFAMFFMQYRVKRCPVCKKHKLQRTNSHIVSRHNGIKTEETTYRCNNCGHTFTRRTKSDDDNIHRGGRGPFIGGGFLGGGGSRGGFGGGSFGGGSFGGGGAGSRF